MIEFKKNKNILIKIAKIILISIIFIFIFKIRKILLDILSPFIISVLIAYLLNPVVNFFEKYNIKRIHSIILVYAFLLFLMILLSFCILPILLRDINVLIESFPLFSEQIQMLVKKFQDGYINSNLPQSLKVIIDNNILLVQNSLLSFFQKIADLFISFFSEILNFIIIPIIVFYMLKDTEYFKNQMILLIPKKNRSKTLELFRDINNVFGKYLRGQLMVSIFVGILTAILLIIIKVKYALILGIFSGLCNIIPYFGPIIGIIPTIIFSLLDSTSKAVYAILAYIIIQQIESGILAPKIIGESVGIHPIYIIFALIMGGKLYGVTGFIIAIPVAAVIKLYIKYVLKKII